MRGKLEYYADKIVHDEVAALLRSEEGITQDVTVYRNGKWFTYDYQGTWKAGTEGITLTRQLSYHLTSDGRLYVYCTRTCHIKGHRHLEPTHKAAQSSCSPEMEDKIAAIPGCEHVKKEDQ